MRGRHKLQVSPGTLFYLTHTLLTFPPEGCSRNLAVDKKQLRVYKLAMSMPVVLPNMHKKCAGLWDRTEGSFFESLASFCLLNQSRLNSSSDVVMISQECVTHVTCKSLYRYTNTQKHSVKILIYCKRRLEVGLQMYKSLAIENTVTMETV